MNRKNNRIKYTLSDGTLAVFSRYKLKGAIHKAILLSDRKVSQQSFLEEERPRYYLFRSWNGY